MDDFDDTNRCVVCGDLIPEGRQVCPRCEKEPCVHVWLFDGIVYSARGKKFLRWRCFRCGKLQLREPVVREWL